MFCFKFQRLQSSRIFFAFGIIFRITIAQDYRIQWFHIPSRGSRGSVRFSSSGAVRLFPALLDEGVRPSYGTFFLWFSKEIARGSVRVII